VRIGAIQVRVTKRGWMSVLCSSLRGKVDVRTADAFSSSMVMV
jgi:hypothetical protein